jgi:hypothetical protein
VSCWAGVYVALFSLARTKLPNYVTPAHPALALMAGCFFYHFTRGAAWAAPIWSRLAFGALAVVGATILVAVPLAAHRYLPGEEWLGLIGLAPLAGAVSCLLMLRRRMRAAAGATFTTTALCLAILLFGVAAERVNRHQKSHVLLNAIIQRLDDPQIGALGCLEPSWVFYGGRPIRELSLDPQQRAAASQQPQAARQPDPWRPNPPIDAAAFLAGGSQRCVITTGKRWQQLRPLVPREVDVLSEAPYFLKDEKLVLVGWTQLSRHAAAPGASGIR